MKVTKRKDLNQLSFFPNLFPVNCYLVEEDDHLTLIDAGRPFSMKGIIKTAEAIGKPLRNLVLTHAHSDHVGALDALTKQLPNVEVSIPRREKKILEGDVSLEKGEGSQPIKGGIPRKIKTMPNVLLEEGDRIGSLLAIDSPGHTPGMMTFLDTRHNYLIGRMRFKPKEGLR